MQEMAHLTAYLDEQLPAALEMLREMVGINSFSGNPEGVNRLGRLTAECFAPLGFQAEFVPSTNPAWGNHLILTRRGTSDKGIAMVSHLDTVFPPDEEERNQFRWQREGDRIFGPGTLDIKGGTVMMWLVLSALRRRAPEVFEALTWKLFFNSSEEPLSPDFEQVCCGRLEAGTLAALVFEAEGRSGDDVVLVVGRKGRGSWKATAIGRGAHAGSKHSSGANAIVQLGRTVQSIAALTDYSRELTFNVGTICGGTVVNRVPHEATAQGEFRAFAPETCAQARQALLALAGPGQVRSPEDAYTCEVKIQILQEWRPWPPNPATQALCELWRQAGAQLGLSVKGEARGGLSDGNGLWDAVPTLDGLGPWGDNDHCSERSPDGSKLPEFVAVSSFVPKAALNVVAILELIRGEENLKSENRKPKEIRKPKTEI
ncbi:MAG: M20/M25/M40 family metallo-hydrolase [Limisphaerales bacterium]